MEYEIKPQEVKDEPFVHLAWAELTPRDIRLTTGGWDAVFRENRDKRNVLGALESASYALPAPLFDAVDSALERAHQKRDMKIPDLAAAHEVISRPEFARTRPFNALYIAINSALGSNFPLEENIRLLNNEADIALKGMNYALLNLGSIALSFSHAGKDVLDDAEYLAGILGPIEEERLTRIYGR